MGITYKAFDVDLQRFAALKVISPRYLADEESIRARFLREARAAGQCPPSKCCLGFSTRDESGELFLCNGVCRGRDA